MNAPLNSLTPYELGLTNESAAIPHLIVFLQTGSPNEKRLAASAVGKLIPYAGTACEQAGNALADCLRDPGAQVRQYALKTLGMLPLTATAITAIKAVYHRDDKLYNRILAEQILRKNLALPEPYTGESVSPERKLSLKQRVEACLDALDTLEVELRENLVRSWAAEDDRTAARSALENAQNRLIVTGLEGKNETERKAHLAEALPKERRAVEETEKNLKTLRRDRDEITAALDFVRQ